MPRIEYKLQIGTQMVPFSMHFRSTKTSNWGKIADAKVRAKLRSIIKHGEGLRTTWPWSSWGSLESSWSAMSYGSPWIFTKWLSLNTLWLAPKPIRGHFPNGQSSPTSSGTVMAKKRWSVENILPVVRRQVWWQWHRLMRLSAKIPKEIELLKMHLLTLSSNFDGEIYSLSNQIKKNF